MAGTWRSGREAGVTDVVIVTGAAGGIGSVISRHLQTAGFAVIPVDQSEPEQDPSSGRFIVGDIRSRDVAKVAIESASSVGSLVGLVNVAAIREYRDVLEFDEEFVDRHLGIDLAAPMLWTSWVARAMQASSTSGSIVNITSVMAHRAVPQNSAYGAAKSGLRGFTRAAALDLAPLGIRVNAVAPGPTATPMLAAGTAVPADTIARIPLGRFGAPDDIAHAVRFLLSGESGFITGTTIAVDGGYLAG